MDAPRGPLLRADVIVIFIVMCYECSDCKWLYTCVAPMLLWANSFCTSQLPKSTSLHKQQTISTTQNERRPNKCCTTSCVYRVAKLHGAQFRTVLRDRGHFSTRATCCASKLRLIINLWFSSFSLRVIPSYVGKTRRPA